MLLRLSKNYDTESVIFGEYTASFTNISFDENFASPAKSIMERVANPHIQAKELYYYVVENVSYSFMAHSAIEADGIPESLCAYEHHFGDCVMQSMLFATLCRSIGVKARIPGGFQLFLGQPGSHLWGEPSLPKYGWVFGNTLAGQLANYVLNVTDDVRRAFIDFYFGNKEPLRMIVRNSVDLEPEGGAIDIQFLSLAMPLPFADRKIGSEDLYVSFAVPEVSSINTTLIR